MLEVLIMYLQMDCHVLQNILKCIIFWWDTVCVGSGGVNPPAVSLSLAAHRAFCEWRLAVL